MMFRSTLSALALLTAFPAAAVAATCGDALNDLRASYAAGSEQDILDAYGNVRNGGVCNSSAQAQAASQVSAVLAARAGRFMAQGDLDRAEAIVMKAPALHWAVQGVRAEIAAQRGQRDEAASLYNAALDTITDPALTRSNPALIPHAERLAKLAQENMMLAGTLRSSVTRGGAVSGVLKSAVRGIAIESVGAHEEAAYEEEYKEKEYKEPVYKEEEYKEEEYKEPEYKEAGDEYAKPPAYKEEAEEYAKAPEYKEEYKEEEYKEPVYKEEEYKEPEYKEVKKEPKYVAPKEYEDPYAGGKKADYEVADKAAKVNKTVFLPIKFGFDSARLDPKGIYEAESIGAFLIANKVKYITLIGHTDEKGSAEYNHGLSLKRAASVRDFLVHYGVKAYIKVDGKGEYEPPKYVDPHIYTDEERRAIARRVELVLEG